MCVCQYMHVCAECICVHVPVCVCMYIVGEHVYAECVCMHVHVCVYIYAYACECVHVHVYTCVCMHACACKRVKKSEPLYMISSNVRRHSHYGVEHVSSSKI